jgi:quercetin dioxygenase-like cupin family protein
MHFDLEDRLRRVRSEPEWRAGDRNSITLAKGSSFRVLLTSLRAGASIGEDDSDGPFSVHSLEGSVLVRRAGEEVRLGPGQIATLESGAPWSVIAEVDAAVLVTGWWPLDREAV